jgi:very-short-patch-repair endonuclease
MENNKVMENNKNEIFIQKAIKIHGDKYDYSQVNYINTKIKVKIICKTHGIFEQLPNSHCLNGYGCLTCSKDKFKITFEEFIKKATEFHEDKYDYSLVEYVDFNTKVKIICKIHGIFEQTPKQHCKSGCKNCGYIDNANKQKSSLNDFIEKANEVHNNKYDYSKVIYNGCFNKVIIICDLHGEFEQMPSKHLYGHGCTICNRKSRNDKFRNTNEEFIKKAKAIHGDLYDYSKVNYVNYGTKVILICKTHGDFEQTPRDHISKIRGCQLCFNTSEGFFYNKLIKYYPTLKTQFRAEWCKGQRYLPFDFYLKEYKIIIELDGGQHFKQVSDWKSPEIQRKNDIYKMNCANSNGYSVIRILQEDVQKNKYDWIKEIKSNIKNIIKTKKVENIFMCKSNEYDNHIELLSDTSSN